MSVCVASSCVTVASIGQSSTLVPATRSLLSRHIPDDRDGKRVRHSHSDMTRARMFALPVAMRTAMTLMCCAAILP